MSLVLSHMSLVSSPVREQAVSHAGDAFLALVSAFVMSAMSQSAAVATESARSVRTPTALAARYVHAILALIRIAGIAAADNSADSFCECYQLSS